MCLYVLQFASGVVKVGRSGNVKARAKSLRITGNGDRIVSAAWTPRMEYQGSIAEGWLLDRVRRVAVQHRSSEYFVGADFGHMLTLLRQAYLRHGGQAIDTGWRVFKRFGPFAQEISRKPVRRLDLGNVVLTNARGGWIEIVEKVGGTHSGGAARIHEAQLERWAMRLIRAQEFAG